VALVALGEPDYPRRLQMIPQVRPADLTNDFKLFWHPL
jgi:hypothetical protein